MHKKKRKKTKNIRDVQGIHLLSWGKLFSLVSGLECYFVHLYPVSLTVLAAFHATQLQQ